METKSRICKICNVEKELKSEFSFHSTTGYYHRTCKECHNKEKRVNYPIISGRREDSIYIRQKQCKSCNEIKDLTSVNFVSLGRGFSKICRVCSDKKKIKKELNKEKNPVYKLKFCNICKEEKSIKDFSYSTKYKMYQYCCRKCDTKRKRDKFLTLSDEEKEIVRKKGREYHQNNKPSSLRIAYLSFDIKKNLENDLTKEFIEHALSKPCSYCGDNSTGLDRLDNSKGHLQSNCIPCCRDCNTARNNNFSYEEMKIIGKAIKEIKDKRKSCQILL